MSKPVLPYRKEEFNEGADVDLDLTHLDKTNALVTPSTLKYRIDDLTNNRQVLDWTDVSTPSSTNTITTTGAQNAKYSKSQPRELRQVTVYAVDSNGKKSYDPFFYTLIRIFDRTDQELD